MPTSGWDGVIRLWACIMTVTMRGAEFPAIQTALGSGMVQSGIVRGKSFRELKNRWQSQY